MNKENKKAVKSVNKKVEKVAKKANKPTKPNANPTTQKNGFINELTQKAMRIMITDLKAKNKRLENENAYLKSRHNDLYRQAKADAYKGFSQLIEENAKTICELEKKIKHTTIYYISAILILSICILILGR